jgi:hypothetical protein
MNPLFIAGAAIAAAVLYATKRKTAAPPAPGGQRRPGAQPQPGPAVQAPVSQSSAGAAPPALVLANAAIQNADKLGEAVRSVSDAARSWFESSTPPPGGASSGGSTESSDQDTAAEDDDGESASVPYYLQAPTEEIALPNGPNGNPRFSGRFAADD